MAAGEKPLAEIPCNVPCLLTALSTSSPTSSLLTSVIWNLFPQAGQNLKKVLPSLMILVSR